MNLLLSLRYKSKDFESRKEIERARMEWKHSEDKVHDFGTNQKERTGMRERGSQDERLDIMLILARYNVGIIWV